ncbi:entericidin A/B family lipoprotein [Tropicimonas isoalkanivorans]|uniref:Predicted small secreted protein n=1 Tax=Tropicimonas isoalkanivorans TaxID=441112 RepID=A0A1I1P1W1_9RHOB|nr:entericidin A/B family lipoprotein [Tropicimonas isoalkanivorans]SFD03819.1 Predicted small secreted protein [Tropicimonas isoalkanivorans]
MTSKPLSLFAILALFALSACETVQGAGRDIENAGETVTDTAQDVEQSL